MENLAFILGLLGILQAIFLPGFLLIRFGRFSFSGLRTLVLSCVLSLTLNYIIVLSLVSLHLYTPLTMRVLLLIELMALAYLSRHTYLRPIRIEGIEKGLAELFRLSPVLSLLVFFILFIFIYQALTGFGSVFTEWDAVVSWNHWAMEWSNNQFASATEHYPQLLPINFSLPYVLIGNFSGPLTLQIFAKAIALLLPLVVLMAMLDLSLNTKNPAYLLGLILMALTYKLIYQDAIGAGYADIPASIMGFISFYALYLAKQSEKALSYIALGTLIAAGAAVTKQAGCYIALLYPVLTYGLFSARHYSFKKCIGLALVQYAVLCVIILPYYLYEQHLITLGFSSL